MAIDMNISDLFFNTDFDHCEVCDLKGNFLHYDEQKLADEAQVFLACLERLNVEVPKSDELIANFYERL